MFLCCTLQERVYAKLNKNHNHASLITSIEEGIKLQFQSRQKNRKAMQEDGATPTPTPSAPSTPTPSEAPSTPNTGGASANNNTAASTTPTSATTPTNSSSLGPKVKRPRRTSENESGAGSSNDGNPGEEAEGPSESGEIELVFRPHPLEMNEDNELIRELKDSSIRYIKTTANATSKSLSYWLWLLIFLVLPSVT